MSMWHFRRVFSAALGQPVMDYVRRHSRALEALTNTSRVFSDIALDHGFGTQQDYTFTFKDIKKPMPLPACREVFFRRRRAKRHDERRAFW